MTESNIPPIEHDTNEPNEPQTEREFVREPVTPEELKEILSRNTTEKLKEGEELIGVFQGTYAVETKHGKTFQHLFNVDGTKTYYWGNYSFNTAIADHVDIMDRVRIRRYPNNVYVVDKL